MNILKDALFAFQTIPVWVCEPVFTLITCVIEEIVTTTNDFASRQDRALSSVIHKIFTCMYATKPEFLICSVL